MSQQVDHPRFLIIDPEPMGARLADDLRRMGRRVDLCPSAQAALTILRQASAQPAVVLLEMRVQEGQSLRLLPILRSASPTTRFLVVTAYGSVASAVQALRLGAENYLCKPVSADRVLHVLDASQNVQHTFPLEYPSLDRAIWEYIQFVLAEEGTISGAARRLGLHPRSLRRMLQKMPPAR
jgi:two-component system response regulator RegA